MGVTVPKLDHEIQSNGLYRLTLENLNNSMALEIYDLVKKWEEEQLMSPWGSLYLVPKGDAANHTIEDTALEMGLKKVVDILRTIPMYGNNKEFMGVSINDAINIYTDAVMWLLENVESYDLTTIVEAFHDMIPDAEEIMNRVSEGGKDLKDWTLMQEKEKVIDIVRERLENMSKTISTARRMLLCERADERTVIIPSGENEGLTFREVIDTKKMYNLVEMLFKNKNDPIIRDIMSFLYCELGFMENLFPYEEFITSFAKLFRLSPDEQIELCGKDEIFKEEDYRKRVKDLQERIMKNLTENVKADE